MSFEPFTIPLIKGLKQDKDGIAAGNPSELEQAHNLMITHVGSLRGRPGTVNESSPYQLVNSGGGTATQVGTDISAATSGLITAGLNDIDNQLLATWQSTAFIRTSTTQPNGGGFVWRQTGPFWSMRKESSPALDFIVNDLGGLQNPVAVGKTLVSVPISAGQSVSLGSISNTNLELLDTQALTNFDVNSRYNACVASNGTNDIILYPKADGSLRYHVCAPSGTPGTGTEQVLAIAGSVNSTFRGSGSFNGQACWLVAGQAASEFFYAYASATVNHIVVGRFVIGGGATATLDLNIGGTISFGVALTHNFLATGAGGKLCLGFHNGTANTYNTKILNVVSTASITDAALDVNHGASSNAIGLHTVGFDTSVIIVCYTDDNNHLRIFTRTFAAAVSTLRVSLFTTSPQLKTWCPLFPATFFNNKTAIGLQLLTIGPNPFANPLVGSTQWFVLDISNNISIANSGSPSIMASGPSNYGLITPPVNAVFTIVDSNTQSLRFGVVNGITFDISGPQSASSTVITLTTCPARWINLNGAAISSGCTPYIYDGVQTYPVNFTEGAPVISSAAFVAGGSSVAGSYSFQAIWEIISGSGKVIRSTQSNITTKTSAGAQKIDITVSIPQCIGRYLTATDTARVKIYATVANPSAGAPLYLASSTLFPISNGSVSVAFVTVTTLQTANTDTTQEQLYTGGNIFDDQAPFSSDRGVAYANNRIWVADANRIFISKILQRNYAPAWNTSGKLTIEMPTVIGEIRSLCNLNDKLLVMGDLGLAIVYGPGFDDIGNGPGWSVELIAQHVKFCNNVGSGPRSSTEIPGNGVAFVGIDNEIYLTNMSGMPVDISWPTKDSTSIIRELSYSEALTNPADGTKRGPMLFSDGDVSKVLDINTGQWFTWQMADSSVGQYSYFATLNNILYAQGIDPNHPISIFSNWTTGTDRAVAFTQIVQTSNCSVAGPDQTLSFAWGRLRSLMIKGKVIAAYTLTVVVKPDNAPFITLMNKSASVTGSLPAQWPYTSEDEFRTTIQRCSMFSIIMSATPATAEWASIDCWTHASKNASPSRNRH